MSQRNLARFYHAVNRRGILFAAIFAATGVFVVATSLASSATLSLVSVGGSSTALSYNQSVYFNWSGPTKLSSTWTYGGPEIEVLCNQVGNTTGALVWYAAIHLTSASPSQGFVLGGTPANNANNVIYYGPTWNTSQPSQCTAILEQASGPHYQYKTFSQYSFTVNP